MFNKILYTFSAKLLTAILNLLIVVLTSRYLGAEGRGVISLLMLNITLIMMCNNFAGGGALVYLTTRENFSQLVVPSYIWAFISASTLSFILTAFNLSPPEYLVHLLLISIIYSLNAVNLNMLLGYERIKAYNFASLFQVFVLFVVFSGLLFGDGNRSISSYVLALYVSFSSGLIATSFLLFKKVHPLPKKNLWDVLKRLFSNGFLVQLGGLIQLLNYRLSYYLLDFFHGAAFLGIYSTGVSVAEALWIFGRSISLVQYARISNTTDLEYSRKLTIKLSKFSFFTTAAALIPLFLLPANIYVYIFGPEFGHINRVILCLAIGILAFSVSGMLSHYFSGIGKFHINTQASAIGFIITVAAGFGLIPKYGMAGAGITATLSYLGSTVFQLIVFCISTRTKLKEFFPENEDIKFVRNEMKLFFQKNTN